MITKKELKEKTGHESFLAFRRNCHKTITLDTATGFTQYFYNRNKSVSLNMKPEELFLAIQREIIKKYNAPKKKGKSK